MKKTLTLLSFISLITIFILYRSGDFTKEAPKKEINEISTLNSGTDSTSSELSLEEQKLLIYSSKSIIATDQKPIIDTLRKLFKQDSLLPLNRR